MKIPEVSSCCCGCTLRTGTLILLWLGAVFGSLKALGKLTGNEAQHIKPDYGSFISIMIFVVGICILGLYGVYKKKPSFLLPILIVNSIQLAAIVLLMLAVFLFNLFAQDLMVDIIQKFESEGNVAVQKPEDIRAALVVLSIMLLMILLISFAVGAYFTVVEYSYYLRLKEEIATNHVGYVGTAQSKAEQGQGGYYPPPYAQPTAP